MSRVPNADLSGVGYAVAVRVNPQSYLEERDVQGRVWSFTMTDQARDGLRTAVRRAFDGPAPDEIRIEPGYVVARFDQPDPQHATGSKLLGQLRDSVEVFNQATPKGTELSYHTDSFAATFAPDGAPTTEEIRERLRGRSHPDTPDADGPVWSYERDDAGAEALDGDERLAFRAFLPFATGDMYAPDPTHSTTSRALPVVWDAPEVHDHLQAVVDDLVPWPGDPRESIPRVAVYPTHAEVDIARDGVAPNPAAVAGKARSALVRYNAHPPKEQERVGSGITQKHPKIGFDGPPICVALDTGRTVDDWIQAHDLDAVDGEPVEPDPHDDAQGDDADAGGALSGLNPFGGT